MWQRNETHEVTCIACGEAVQRSKAREYDKHGNRWERADKEFEHLCKPCYRELCHQPRDGLEAALVGFDEHSRDEFLSAWFDDLPELKERRD